VSEQVRSGVDFETESRTDSYRPIWQLTECLYLAVISARYACVARAGDIVSLNLEAFQVLTRFKVSGSLSISGSGKGFGVEAIEVESLGRIALESLAACVVVLA
jgi:hypothetical protein